jgi:hypothetical protein
MFFNETGKYVKEEEKHRAKEKDIRYNQTKNVDYLT